MFKLSDSVAFRRSVTGVLLFVAPLLQFVALLVDPGTWGDDREMVSYGDNPALAQLESALYHWSWLLVPIAAFGLLHLVRRKSVVFGHIAGGMTIIGYISVSALLLMDPVEWWFGQHYPVEQGQKMFDEVFNLPGVIFGFTLPWIYLGMVGLPLLLLAVSRTGFVHWWVPAVVAVGYLGAAAVPYSPLTIPFWGAPVIAMGYLGLKVLRMTNSEWASYYPSADPGVTTPDSYANTTA